MRHLSPCRTNMPTPSWTQPPPRRRGQIVLLALTVLLIAVLWQHGPIAQWPGYHEFADRRAWLGLPNAADVLSNLPFAGVGLWGLMRLRPPSLSMPAHAAWRVLCIALIATSAGSAFYHWAPANGPLVADRLPIAWACAALLCGFLAERLDTRWGSARVLTAALCLATASVLYWWFSEQRGAGDLRPYLLVQFAPMLLIPATLWLKPIPVATGCTAAGAWWVMLGLYAAAKAVELADQSVFDTLGWVSGHTVKHLLAAAATAWIVRAILATGPAPSPARDQLR